MSGITVVLMNYMGHARIDSHARKPKMIDFHLGQIWCASHKDQAFNIFFPLFWS